MASLNLSQDDLKSLESTRQRLATLVASISSMRESMVRSDPLPAPSSLDASANILQRNIESVLEVIYQNADLFQRVVVHPSTNFPGRQHEGILLSLLRKKLEPDVEVTVEAAREAALAAGIGPQSFVAPAADGAYSRRRFQQRRRHDYDEEDDDDESDDEEGYRGPDEDDEDMEEQDGGGPREPLGLGDLWFEAREWLGGRMHQFVREEEPEFFTKEERAMGVQSVRTGLKRNLLEDEEDEDDEDDDDDEEEDDDDDDDPDIVILDQPPPQSTKLPQQQPQQAGTAPALAPPAPPPGIDPEVALWFACRGDMNLPANVERLSRPRKAPDARRGP